MKGLQNGWAWCVLKLYKMIEEIEGGGSGGGGGDVKISKKEGNSIELLPDGLYATTSDPSWSKVDW